MKNLLETCNFLFAEAKIKASEVGITGPQSDAQVLKNILNTVYFWGGFLAVAIIVYGGFLYVLSSGDATKVKKAKDAILYAVIGVVVMLSAWAITNFVITGV